MFEDDVQEPPTIHQAIILLLTQKWKWEVTNLFSCYNIQTNPFLFLASKQQTKGKKVYAWSLGHIRDLFTFYGEEQTNPYIYIMVERW